MLETHARLREARAARKATRSSEVAEHIADEARLLCFDEMIVNNPADAMILSRLFEQLLERGVRVVTTSNRPPGDLYKDGLNRELFVPFIDLIEQRMRSGRGRWADRLSASTACPASSVWHVPNGPEATAALERGLLQAHRLSGRGPRQGADRRARRRRRAHATRAQEPQGRRRFLVQALVRRSRAGPPTISPSRSASTRSSSSGFR